VDAVKRWPEMLTYGFLCFISLLHFAQAYEVAMFGRLSYSLTEAAHFFSVSLIGLKVQLGEGDFVVGSY
jgi:hypothetical protein